MGLPISTPAIKPNRSGFSLVELSIVVAIMSIVAVSGLEIATQFIGARAITTTQAQLSSLDVALDQFYRAYGRLPCPAQRGYGPTHPTLNYGKEDCSIAALTNTTTYGGVLAGVVPFRTLGLPLSSAIDAYGAKIHYLVTRNLAIDSATAATSGGGITVRSGNFTTFTVTSSNVAYVLNSTGPDKRGSVNKLGAVNSNACLLDNDVRIDAQNCRWTTPAYSTNPYIYPYIVYDSRFNNGSVKANYFDDLVVWRARSQL